MERCINCGTDLPPDQASCPTCKASALGSTSDAKVEVDVGEATNVPAVCCCCLAPKELDSMTQLLVGYKRYVMVPVPWCKGCKQRSSIAMLFLIVGMFGLATILVLVVKLLDETAYGMMTLALFVGLIGGAILGLQVANRLNKRGHVAKCNAVGSMVSDAFDRDGRKGGKFAFGNRMFAKEWSRLNPKG